MYSSKKALLRAPHWPPWAKQLVRCTLSRRSRRRRRRRRDGGDGHLLPRGQVWVQAWADTSPAQHPLQHHHARRAGADGLPRDQNLRGGGEEIK